MSIKNAIKYMLSCMGLEVHRIVDSVGRDPFLDMKKLSLTSNRPTVIDAVQMKAKPYCNFEKRFRNRPFTPSNPVQPHLPNFSNRPLDCPILS